MQYGYIDRHSHDRLHQGAAEGTVVGHPFAPFNLFSVAKENVAHSLQCVNLTH